MDLTQMKPLKNRVIVKEIHQEKIGSIWIPQVAGKGGSGRSDRGTVIACGPECEGYGPGSTVIFSLLAPMVVMDDHLLVSGDDIIAVLED